LNLDCSQGFMCWMLSPKANVERWVIKTCLAYEVTTLSHGWMHWWVHSLVGYVQRWSLAGGVALKSIFCPGCYTISDLLLCTLLLPWCFPLPQAQSDRPSSPWTETMGQKKPLLL
jgi:hypothetical protein